MMIQLDKDHVRASNSSSSSSVMNRNSSRPRWTNAFLAIEEDSFEDESNGETFDEEHDAYTIDDELQNI